MNKIFKNASLFLIFFMLYLSKDFLYGLFKEKDNSFIKDSYITYLENEINDINKFDVPSNFYLGKILYQNPYKFNDELYVLINTDNINENNYVLSDGFLGTVKKVFKNYVLVKLITSKDFIMQVKINDCYGIYKNENDKNIVKNIKNNCNVNVNDKVYTSNLGYSNIEYEIGYVSNIIYDENEIENTYIINLKTNLNKLKYVYIEGNK